MDCQSEDTVPNHLGYFFVDCMKKYPDAICQIDAATGKEETNASVLSRSVKLARCLSNIGLQPGDIISISGRNHLDLHIPLYAGLLNGLPVTAVDTTFKFDEIKSLLTITRPKVVFCQQESYDDNKRALQELGLDTKIITFDGQENNMNQFVESYSNEDTLTDFKPANFDTNKVFAFLIPTSGTTGGKIKAAAISHEVIMGRLYFFKKSLEMRNLDVPQTRSVTLNLSPVQWVTGVMNALALPVLNQVKLQTSKADDVDHIIYIINKYKPTYCFISPVLAATLLQHKDEVDLTCFRSIVVSGSKVNQDVIGQLKPLLRADVEILEPYGLTETVGVITFPLPSSPAGSCGVPVPPNRVKLVDPNSGKEITEANVTGELWVKGPRFTEYYNDPQATVESLSEDGYFKSGDLLYRDEKNHYYFVDRIKSLIKYRNSHVLPVEVEEVILSHPGVQLACVCGVTHIHDGQRAAACVQLRPGWRVSEQEIKELVAHKLSKSKQLHGGVMFVEEMPMTSSGKIATGKVKKLLNSVLQQK